jgi:hypothetical protein
MKSSVELEQDLALARQAEREAEAEAAARRREAERRREDVAKSALTLVQDLDHRIERVPAEMARLAGGTRPDWQLRQDARRLLVGNLSPLRSASGELLAEAPELICRRDEAARHVWSLNGVARQLLARVGADLGADHRLVRRLDLCETTSWRLWVHRLRQLAGEVD